MNFQALSFIQHGISHLFRFADPHSQTQHHKSFLKDCVTGLIGGQTCTLAGIARTSADPFNFKTECKRLSHGLAHMKAPWEDLETQLLDDGAQLITKDHIIAVDVGDLSKDYALTMENLYSVYDGSTGEIGKGYEDFSIVGISWGGNQQHLVPLYSRLSNASCVDYLSQNAQIINAVFSVYDAVKPGYGIWVFDRGFDRAVLMDKIFYEKLDLRFIVRSTGVRLVHLVNKDGTISTQAQSIEEIAHGMVLEDQYGLVFPKVVGPLQVGSTQVQVTIEGYDEGNKVYKSRILNLVVIRHPDFATPIMLLTPLKVSSGTDAVLIFAYYLERWGIENFFRLKKTVLGSEQIRVHSLDSIRRLNWICNLTLFLVIAYYRQHPGFVEQLCDRLLLHERLTHTLKIPYYRVIDCLKVLLEHPEHLSSKELPPPGKNLNPTEAPGHPLEQAALNIIVNKEKNSTRKVDLPVLNSKPQFQTVELQSTLSEKQISHRPQSASVSAQVNVQNRKPANSVNSWQEPLLSDSIQWKKFERGFYLRKTKVKKDDYFRTTSLPSSLNDHFGEHHLVNFNELSWAIILFFMFGLVRHRNGHSER
jgi:hypothetical protein